MAEPRVNVNIRLSAEGLAAIDKMAEQEQRSRSAMLRILIGEAVKARSKRGTPRG